MPERRRKGWVSAGRCAGPAAIPARAAPPLPRHPGCDRGEVFRARKGPSTMGFPRKSYSNQTSAPRDHYQDVTDRIIAALEAGVVPWRRAVGPGPGRPGRAAVATPPPAGATRGINVLMLALSPFAWRPATTAGARTSRRRARGWQVRQRRARHARCSSSRSSSGEGRRGCGLSRSGDGDAALHPDAARLTPCSTPPRSTVSQRLCRDAARGRLAPPGGGRRHPAQQRGCGPDRWSQAFYSPATDHIQLPPHEAFSRPEAWGATALHELAHCVRCMSPVWTAT